MLKLKLCFQNLIESKINSIISNKTSSKMIQYQTSLEVMIIVIEMKIHYKKDNIVMIQIKMIIQEEIMDSKIKKSVYQIKKYA